MEDEGSGATPPASEEDDVLRERSFKRPKGLNLDSFMVASTGDEETAEEVNRASDDETAPPTLSLIHI